MRKFAFPVVFALSALLYVSCSPSSKVLSILSYNVRPRTAGADDIRDYRNVALFIESVRPDITVLQQVDFTTGRADSIDAMTVFKDVAFVESGFASNVAFDEHANGVAILTENLPMDSWSVPLPGENGNPVALVHEYSDCVIISVQFPIDEEEQIESIAVLDSVAVILATMRKPVLVAGSMFFTLNSDPFLLMSRNFMVLNKPWLPTYPSYAPLMCLDYIWGYTGSGVTYNVLNSETLSIPRKSMHKPVIAAFEYKLPKKERK